MRIERVGERECVIRGELIPVEYLRDSPRGEEIKKFPGLSSGGSLFRLGKPMVTVPLEVLLGCNLALGWAPRASAP